MKKNLNFALVLVFIVMFVFLGIALGRYTTGGLTSNSAELACTSTMDAVIASAQGDVYNMSGVADYEEPVSYYLAKYNVQGDLVTDPTFEPVPADLKDEQNNSSLQAEAWSLFTDLVPLRDRQMVAQFNVFTDGFENTLAAVDQRQADPSQWMLEIDIADLQNKDALMFTMIHEYAHLLTLNASQVTPDQEIVDDPYNWDLQAEKAAACPNYFSGTGCSQPDSYIQAFYTRFWADINDEWEKVDLLQHDAEDFNPYYDGLYNFYKSHRDQFLDDYSTTHPAEDIAESFAYFIFSPRPSGSSIKEQKILFFYDYPELVQLRQEILSGACAVK